ncbi:unnamed protein product [marine sediment metagenome]|uniref:DinB-like domain-containing protein n=1 Tax=marine sediment metagenome TaxID=412755 RepID=X1T5N8_9ZZZZ
MTTVDKKHLLDLLSESHTANMSLLEGNDMEVSVHADSDWQIRDIIWHIAVWDRQVTKSIRAFKDGGEYAIPALKIDEFNERAFQEGRKLTKEQVIEEYEQARGDFKASVQELPQEKYSEDLLYPWGDERGDISQLVEYLVEHDAEHRDEIAAALAS